MPFLGHIVGCRGLECDPKKIEDVKAYPGLPRECPAVPGVRRIFMALCPRFCRPQGTPGVFDR